MEESPSGAGSHKRTRPVEAAGAADAQTRPPRLGKHCAFSPSFHRALPHHKHTQRKTRKSTGHWASWSPFSQFRTHTNFRRAPLYTREPPSARNSVRRTIVQLQRPSPQPTLTWNGPEPLLSGHFSDTAPHLCPFVASLRCTWPRVSLPAPAAPRSSAASRRRAAGSDALPQAGASSTAHASPDGPPSSPAAAGDLSATSA